MKKRTLIFILLVLVSVGSFAQFAVEGSYGVLGGTPLIGVRYDFSRLDIMAGVELYFRQYNYDEDSSASDYSYWNRSVGIYTGIAPKIVFSDHWTLSFPLLAAVGFGGRSKYATASGSSDAGYSIFGLRFVAGSRVTFFFSEHFSLYFGFLLYAVSWEQTKFNTWTGSPGGGTKLSYTMSDLYILNSGNIPIGLRNCPKITFTKI